MTFCDPKVRLRLKEIGDMQHVGRHWAKSPMAKTRYCKDIAETTWQWKFQKYLLVKSSHDRRQVQPDI